MSRRERLNRVAEAFLREPEIRPLRVATASASRPEPAAAVAEALVEAARRLESHEDPLRLRVENHGAVTEDRLDSLRAPGDRAVDVLVWSSVCCTDYPFHELYLLGMWVWSLAPRSVVYLVSPGVPATEHLRAGLESAMTEAGLPEPAALVTWPREGDPDQWLRAASELLEGLPRERVTLGAA